MDKQVSSLNSQITEKEETQLFNIIKSYNSIYGLYDNVEKCLIQLNKS